MTDKKTTGKKARASGKRFEIKVREDLEKKKWIVDRWTNNVSDVFEEDIGEYNRKLIPCKPKFNPFTKRVQMMSGGFPDFVAFSQMTGEDDHKIVIGVECKSGTKEHNNNQLSPEEKEKCKWLINNKIFSRIEIARKGERGEILYEEWKL